MTEIEFTPWPKIARLNREIVITEKIDGTNAAVGVTEDGQVYAQSRSKLITPATPEDKQSDNHGFAAWVRDHEVQLRDGLGVGVHFGEWWGPGIGKRYKWDAAKDYSITHYPNMKAPGGGQMGYLEPIKRFSLFNTGRWTDDIQDESGREMAPLCCNVVPVLYQGDFSGASINYWVDHLRDNGSLVCPGSEAEGVVIYHTHARTMFKVTLKNDAMSKGEAQARILREAQA